MSHTLENLEIIATKGNISLIKISTGNYCVRKAVPSKWFRASSHEFFNLNIRGTDLTADCLISGITVGDFERCNYIFNCNTINSEESK
jgi:hypothetical protein